jgi:leukotriene-A4 hydrolase
LIFSHSFSLKGVDPDDAFSSVPYEKGFNFLQYLTGLVGGFEVFEKFLYSYFNQVRYYF